MTAFTTSELRSRLGSFLARVQHDGEHIIVTRHGITVAALIPYQDLELLRAMEDRIDLAAAEAALRDAKIHGFISWDDFKESLQLPMTQPDN